MAQSVFFFGKGSAEGTRDMTSVLGGKGANLAEMTNLGVPVPPGFTIAASECIEYLRSGKYSDKLRAEVEGNVARLEEATGKKLGDPRNPLLVSVRSGAAVSMPGMMETILNLGLNDRAVVALAEQSRNARFAYDSYRRFIQMYSSVVLGVSSHDFEHLLKAKKMTAGAETDTQLGENDLRNLVEEYKALVRNRTGADFPRDPIVQLWGAIEAVWRSWTLKKAKDYRRVHAISEDLGTAVSVVAMVFGNLGDDSGTGVAFTRNPSTGEKRFYGEFLVNAQGEDVVAGTRTPLDIDEMAERLPDAYKELMDTQVRLEKHYRDMQDLEFTVERGKLFLLQTRTGKRTAAAAVQIARDMVKEGLIDRIEAVLRVPAAHLDQLLHPIIDPSIRATPLCQGLPASPGAASGVAVFDPDTASQRSAAGENVILVRDETTPEDFHGIVASRAVLTRADDPGVDAHDPQRPGVDLAPANAPLYQSYSELLGWADEVRTLRVRANADTPRDARIARSFGAEGIGLCRTEHMFFEGDRITAMREMIVAREEGGRRRALSKLLPMQRADFEGIFEAMDGLPVTIRLLDPPLHEFLPHGGEEAKLLARTLGIPRADLNRIIESLRETNPMLGHRGCRLGITYPEITEMQARAILEAAVRAMRRGINVRPEIMIPLVSTAKEFENQRAIVEDVAQRVLGGMGEKISYLIGTMIELPRAALTAAQIAETAQFFSFGTNDLTQTTLGLSRDDAGRFLPSYIDKGILADDPFQVLDTEGVGRLVRMAVEEGRRVRPDIKLGICGEHGGEPRSISFCHSLGLDYVSCSPFRVPIARLAAAHAALKVQA